MILAALGNDLLTLLLAVLMAAACFGAGWLVLQRLPEPIRLGEGCFLYAAAFGAAVVSLLWTLLGWLRLYTPIAAVVLLVPGAATILVSLIRLRRTQPSSLTPRSSPFHLFTFSPFHLFAPRPSLLTPQRSTLIQSASSANLLMQTAMVWFCRVVIFLSLLTGLVAALAPPVARDAMIYHLAAPQRYVEAHGFVDLPWNVFSYVPMHVEMLYVWGLLLGQDSLPALIHWFYGLLAGGATWQLARQCGATRWASLAAAAMFLTIPTTWRLLGQPYTDLPMVFYTTLAFCAFLEWRRDRQAFRMLLTGALLGLAASTRYQALVLWPMLALGILMTVRESDDPEQLRRILPSFVAAFVLSCILVVPWWVRNALWTHNPLFPYLLQLFPTHSLYWDANRQALSLQILKNYGGANKGIADYFLLPWNLVVNAQEETPALFDGVIGPTLWLGLVPFFLWKRLSAEVRYALGFFLSYALFWMFSSQQVRWLIYVIPALLAAAASMMESEIDSGPSTARSRHPWTILFASVCLCFNVGWILLHFVQSGTPEVAFGMETKDNYLAQKTPTYNEQQYLNNHIPADARVMLIDAGSETFYLHRPEFHDSVLEDWTISHIAAQSATPEEIGVRLRQMGISYLLVGENLLFNPETSPFSDTGDEMAAAGERLKAFLQQDTQVLFKGPNDYVVRKILGG